MSEFGDLWKLSNKSAALKKHQKKNKQSAASLLKSRDVLVTMRLCHCAVWRDEWWDEARTDGEAGKGGVGTLGLRDLGATERPWGVTLRQRWTQRPLPLSTQLRAQRRG